MKGILDGGVNVVRINFSHNDEKDHLKRIKAIRQYEKENDTFIGIMMDLQGPKIRISSFKNAKVKLSLGDQFILDADLPEMEGDHQAVGIAYKELPNDLNAGNMLLLDDGKIILKVDRIKNSKIFTTVLQAGTLYNNKGINLRGGGLSASALTDKDRSDILIAAKADADYVAISFPINADDVRETKRLLLKAGSNASVIAKIERAEALEEDIITEIIQESAGIMVARGDLGVEIGDPQLPAQQKRLIQLARANDRFVITATQMLESMISSPIPTRAEVFDVANAVLDGTDAVMLSAETAAGDYPEETVATMARVCLGAESQKETHVSKHRLDSRFSNNAESIALSAMYAANHLDSVKAIITLTESGSTAKLMSRISSGLPIYSLSRHASTLGQTALYRGVYPVFFDSTKTEKDGMVKAALDTLVSQGSLQSGDTVIITHGDSMETVGATNTMKIVTVA